MIFYTKNCLFIDNEATQGAGIYCYATGFLGNQTITNVTISNNIGGWNSILDLRDQNITEPGMLIKNNHKGNWLHFEYLPSNDGASPQDWIVLLQKRLPI